MPPSTRDTRAPGEEITAIRLYLSRLQASARRLKRQFGPFIFTSEQHPTLLLLDGILPALRSSGQLEFLYPVDQALLIRASLILASNI
ncbi:hypothetical protein CBOM_03416 [Ceraceosorus bombacis]|uniref:Uncharacterized protein n=1 Tax=Ceraceosorus bombacis TaxID=401625 RepID=A0A0N7LAS1_9BASI|nr:hypothetical protein CBOM_03416 [Ceraceosorus bombacis]